MRIEYSPKFDRQFRKLPSGVKAEAVEREAIFRKDPFDARLASHKLSGKLTGYLAFSISHRYRIVFSVRKNGREKVIRFHTVGTHAIYNQ